MTKRTGAPFGIAHGKASATWDEVERVRTMHESGLPPSKIAQQTGKPLNTIKDWIYYRTRHYA
jgi:hypothetical protein